jgi:hypothetical protein
MKFLFLFINEFSCLFLQIDMNGVFYLCLRLFLNYFFVCRHNSKWKVFFNYSYQKFA